MREHFVGDFVTNAESLETIRRVYEEAEYLLDPHTAVAWKVAERLRGDDPVLVVSTVHWAKFAGDVYRPLSGIAAGEALPEEVAKLSGPQLLAEVQKLAPEGACAPRTLAELDSQSERFNDVVDAGRAGVEGAVREWLG